MPTSAPPLGTARPRTWLVAAAACLWGTSALMREPLLATGLPASMIVLAEHLLLVAFLLPWLAPAVRGVLSASWRTRVSVLVIGAGSSALATTMFTAAFRLGDPITPQVLQKLQPVIAIVLAAVLLGERLRPTFWWFAVPALAGAWLLAFRDPFQVDLQSAQGALLAGGAAALWAAGTVLGRAVTSELRTVEVTALRFAVGLITMVVVVSARDEWTAVPVSSWPTLALLALVPGLAALLLYYRGLSRTPASKATLAELAFPLTAAFVGVVVLDGRLELSQWAGFVVVLVAVTAMSLQERVGGTQTVTQERPLAPVG